MMLRSVNGRTVLFLANHGWLDLFVLVKLHRVMNTQEAEVEIKMEDFIA